MRRMPLLPTAAPDLDDGVVRLRPLHVEDAAWMAEACRDDDILRWTPIPRGITAEEIAGWIARSGERLAADLGVDWAVVDARSGEPLGHAGLHQVQPALGQGEVTYWTAPAVRGRGVAPRAVELIAGWAFAVLQLERLELLTYVDNLGSQRVAAKAGFVREGVRRGAVAIKGERPDLVAFARLRSDRP
jgi:RimJ/RimL family protein N-acetyltransferase